MTLQEKTFYQQIHPLRLFVDWTTGFYSCYLFWQQDVIPGLFIAFIPSIIVSMFLAKFGELETLKNSTFGKYLRRTSNKTVDLIRLAAFSCMAAGSWFHQIPIAAVGLLVVIGTWTYGLFVKSNSKR